MSFEVPKIDGDSNLNQKDRVELKLSPDTRFRKADGNFDVLKKEDRILTRDDVQNLGFLSSADKADVSFRRLLKRKFNDNKVESLSAGKLTFIPLEEGEADIDFLKAAAKFNDAQPGVIIAQNGKDLLNWFSAIRLPNGKVARLLRGPRQEDLEEFIKHLSNLVPYLEAAETDDNQTVYAIEFVQEAEHPEVISEEKLEDWLNRSKSSGISFSFDVSGKNDALSLDNFIKKAGKLYYIDGDIVSANMAKDQEELNHSIEEQERILRNYTKAN
ncbi:MAG TPA: hypothetical protein VFK07_01390 [Candidatus Paceibacterota bacterium]|nr:hypothetical protein [Candidatus Paceibacterota bacterium]